jgi:splicing factor 3B subunit 3
MFRSSYAPVKDVIDGDLCEIFPTLDLSKQRVLAEELNRNPNEVNKKLEQARLKLL